MELAQNWVLMAVLTPTFWAMGCVLDTCLIGGKVYRAPSDGAMVSCIFCLAPAVFALGLLTSSSSSSFNSQEIPLTAIAAGVAYTIHLFFYFRTLYCFNDVSGAETFISLSVLFVPLFAWWLLDEVLPFHFYLAFFIAGIGVILQCLPVIRNVGISLLINMLITMIAVSLSMVLQSSALSSHGFTTATLFFNATCFTVAMIIFLCRKNIRRRMARLYRNFPMLIFFSELLGILAILCSHRATHQGPSVSLVTLIECLLPLIIIAISMLLISANRIVPILSPDHLTTLAMQLRGTPMKIVALVLLMSSLSILSF